MLNNDIELVGMNDRIVDEVRAIREAHTAQFNYNLRAIFEDLKKSETARMAAGHPFVSSSLSAPNTSTQQVRFAHRRL